MSNKALIIVDYSFDFIDDSGKINMWQTWTRN